MLLNAWWVCHSRQALVSIYLTMTTRRSGAPTRRAFSATTILLEPLTTLSRSPQCLGHCGGSRLMPIFRAMDQGGHHTHNVGATVQTTLRTLTLNIFAYVMRTPQFRSICRSAALTARIARKPATSLILPPITANGTMMRTSML